ncbi:MAG: glycosyltransferase [Alphaproteobacteria bacterium]|nr:glycosyltransferase [Alphaproteobacteria bacterium]
MTAPRLALAVLVHDLSATGVVRNAIRVAVHMAATGHRTEIWVNHDRGAFRADVPATVTIRQIGSGRRLPTRRLETLHAIGGMARLIRESQPAVLLSAGNHFHLAGGLAYRYAGRPAATRFMGRASNATPRLSLPWFAWLANRIDAAKYAEMHRVIAVSHELAADLESRLGIESGRIAIIPNGVDIPDIARRSAEPLDDPWFAEAAPPVIISAGRLARQKNYSLLLDAFARLRRQRPARLVILGDGTVSARKTLQDHARALGIGDDLRLQGFEPNPLRYFARAALFALSSRWEGASNVLLEAMACGCPVVAVDCPTGVREQLDQGRIGPIVPQDNPSALAAAMADRLDAPRGSEGLRTHAATFDLQVMLAAYERLLAPGSAGQILNNP